ncbi:iron chelate uptake ABC transporter family permease subunit [bacterium]|nr:iron chelate uptake ABC transporter family permease subunit [bacterium]
MTPPRYPLLAYPVLAAGLAIIVACLCVMSMLTGPSPLGVLALIGGVRGEDADTAWLILREVRLPRTLLAAMIGFSLGLAGAALQGYLRNPLADPGVIGVSATAAFGAVLALYTGLSLAFPLALPLTAIGAALVCVLLLEGLAGRGGALGLILAGVAISSLAGALTSLALNLSPNPYAALEIIFWLLGSVTDRSLDQAALAAPFMFAGWVILLFTANSLNALSLGEEAAAGLGVDLSRLRLLVVLGAAVSVGAATAVAGAIGFVGLIVPHMLRGLVGHRPGPLLLVSGLGGAVLLLSADILVRLISVGSELRLGVVTALLGAPVFLSLAMRSRRMFGA